MFYCVTNKTTSKHRQQHAVVNIINVTPRNSLYAVEIAALAECYNSGKASSQFNREEIGTRAYTLCTVNEVAYL